MEERSRAETDPKGQRGGDHADAECSKSRSPPLRQRPAALDSSDREEDHGGCDNTWYEPACPEIGHKRNQAAQGERSKRAERRQCRRPWGRSKTVFLGHHRLCPAQFVRCDHIDDCLQVGAREALAAEYLPDFLPLAIRNNGDVLTLDRQPAVTMIPFCLRPAVIARRPSRIRRRRDSQAQSQGRPLKIDQRRRHLQPTQKWSRRHQSPRRSSHGDNLC